MAYKRPLLSMIRKILPFYLFLLLGLFLSCSTDNDEIKDPNNNNNEEEQQKEDSFIKESDLYGVWTVLGGANYFIYFTETGKYSFCFNSTQMGGGTFSLDKNEIILNNAYLNTRDVLTLEKNGVNLNISGEIQKFKSNIKEQVNVSAFKTKKELPITKTGEVFKIWGLNAKYGDVITYIKYETEYLIKYQYCKDNALKQVISEQNWFYVYNDGMTYTQDCSGEGNVVIYNLRDHYTPLSSQIVKQ